MTDTDRSGIIPGTEIRWRLRRVSDFRQNDTNPVEHSDANMQMVVESVKRFGALRSGVSSHGKIIGGNLTQRAMQEAGIQDVLEISSDGSVWTMVERPDLSEQDQQLAAYYDQQASNRATWDADQVAMDHKAQLPILTDDFGMRIFSALELDGILQMAGVFDGQPNGSELGDGDSDGDTTMQTVSSKDKPIMLACGEIRERMPTEVYEEFLSAFLECGSIVTVLRRGLDNWGGAR